MGRSQAMFVGSLAQAETHSAPGPVSGQVTEWLVRWPAPSKAPATGLLAMRTSWLTRGNSPSRHLYSCKVDSIVEKIRMLEAKDIMGTRVDGAL